MPTPSLPTSGPARPSWANDRGRPGSRGMLSPSELRSSPPGIFGTEGTRGGRAMTIVVSCGEPAGIGPEVAAKAWDALRLPLLWIGDPRHLPPGTPIIEVSGPEEAEEAAGRALPVLARDFGPPVVPGQPDPAHAQPVIDAIAEGVALIRDGRASAICTAPISKAALVTGA